MQNVGTPVVRYNQRQEHFVILHILGFLHDSQNNSRANPGYVTLSDLFQYMQSLGYVPFQIDAALSFMHAKELFETSDKGRELDTGDNYKKIRITSSGAYHFIFLPCTFTYIDAIIIDVPIFGDYRFENPETIELRLNRASDFSDYLTNVWEQCNFPNQTYFNWPQQAKQLTHDISCIRSKIENKST